MNTRLSARFLILAFGVTTSTFLLLVAAAIYLLWETENTVTQETYDQSGIAAIQLRVHYEALNAALANALMNDQVSADDAENVAMQFDILYGRVKGLPTRPGYEYLLDAELMKHQRALLEALTRELPHVDKAAEGDGSGIAGMYARLAALRHGIERLAHRPVQIASELRSYARGKLSDVTNWLTGVVVAFTLSGAVLMFVVLHQMHTAIMREKLVEKSRNELQEAKIQLEHVAYVDGLTGLANRTQCQQDLADRIPATGTGEPFAFIQIDLDNFKRVNDTHGHAAGDELLRTLGERLRLFSGGIAGSKFYRWGGDEFIAIIDHGDGIDINHICDELTDLISIPLQYEQVTLHPTISLGVAHYPADTDNIEALVVFADLALYKAKELGRDGYQFFTNEMKDKIDAEAQLERDLRTAIAEHQLELYYQPQVSTSDERVTGVEALLRWNHPERGVMLPGDFIDIVETSGLAPSIGRIVFDQAMRTVRRWSDADLEFGRLAINLSPAHLKQGFLIEDYFAAIDRHGVAADLLAVELLESFLLDDLNANVLETLETLRRRGVAVELDDFGTGYASLSHLSSLPIDGFKVDRSFIARMNDDSKHMNIVSAMISMSKLIGLSIVCEGVETPEHVRTITGINDCSIQGFHVARPMPFETATTWLAEKRNIGSLHISNELKVVGG